MRPYLRNPFHKPLTRRGRGECWRNGIRRARRENNAEWVKKNDKKTKYKTTGRLIGHARAKGFAVDRYNKNCLLSTLSF